MMREPYSPARVRFSRAPVTLAVRIDRVNEQVRSFCQLEWRSVTATQIQTVTFVDVGPAQDFFGSLRKRLVGWRDLRSARR